MTHRLVFGLDRLCPNCKGDGHEHRFHVRDVVNPVTGERELEWSGAPVRQRIECEHPCRSCAGSGFERRHRVTS